MGKHLRRKRFGVPFRSNHPGCTWGILHMLDYHRWNHVKKMLPHKRHDSRKHAMGIGIPGLDTNDPSADKIEEHIDAEKDNSLIEEPRRRSSPAAKTSVKARIKALIAEERSKKRGQHHRSSTYPAQNQLTRTLSIHHLEPSDQDYGGEIISNGKSPIIVRPNIQNSTTSSTLGSPQLNIHKEPIVVKRACEACGSMLSVNSLGSRRLDEHGEQQVDNHMLQERVDKGKQALLEQKLMYAKELSVEASLHQSKEFLDALDLISMNRDLFLKILQDPDSPLAHHFHGERAYGPKMELSRSGSFPAVGSSGRRGYEPSKLRQEQEIGSHSKGEGKLQGCSEAPKFVEFKSTENIFKQSMPLTAENEDDKISESSHAKPEAVDGFSPISTQLLNNPIENQAASKRFKDLKQKIKHVIKENRKEKHRISMDAIFHKIPYGQRFSKDELRKEPAMDRDNKDSPGSSYGSNHSAPASSKGGLHCVRRTASLNESLDKYCQLFELSFNREAKNNVSERLKLRTEEETSSSERTSKSLGRILSLPDLKSYFYIRSEDSYDSFSSRTPLKNVVESMVSAGSAYDAQKDRGSPTGPANNLQLNRESENEENAEVSEIGQIAGYDRGSTSIANDAENARMDQTIEGLGNFTRVNNVSLHEQEVSSRKTSIAKFSEPSPVSLPISSFQDTTSIAKLSAWSEADMELKSERILLDGLEQLTNQQCESCMNFSIMAESRVLLEEVNISKQLDRDFQHPYVDIKDEAEFNYVRDILELSGFSKNEILGAWHSTHQPMDSSVFEEMEGCLLVGSDSSESEEGGNYSHTLLFDLINEVLMDIYERSLTYCPVLLTSLSHIRPMPVGSHVLEEVWANISWYLSFRPDLDQSLDYVVSQDLSKGDGWMNLQFDTECVGLEVEDLIFDELLEEVICT
ncbi:uncharacterized protein LOC131159763 [Malania oleifera]|uniref:uncharacterized protein LOC131159763 n=1 Tax=Malania oleifera TaxID=397392 RepID=UPI0025ADC1F6|nr:uncharacterized protein LOC131159763 [Malania oleifera]XP_057970903.1 uncharacterized protein LOC131159763 [Malania oleifera]